MSLLALLNPSKAFLAMSAVLAGYCLFRFYAYTVGNTLVMPYLLASGALLAMADSAWQLIFTVAAENEGTSDNLPAGAISTTASYLITVFTTIAGLMCAMTGGYNSFRVAGIMIILMLFRSALFRSTEVLSPLFGGLSTGMTFIIGMTAHPSFSEMFLIDETRIPAKFFALYMIVAAVLSHTRDTSKPRDVPASDGLANEVASRLMEIRDDAVDRSVVWFGGGALILIPLALAWVMPWRWLSWTLQVFLAMSLLFKLTPVLVYRTRRDLSNFIESVYRGGALLNAGGVASLGDYRLKEIYDGWLLPMPGRDELAAVAIIALLSAPAWLLRRAAPIETS
ncbi:MAG: hypothetical protein FWG74_09510 [Planctomycetes bacterium]|nr:hypothetical protein [Planctomycetota bacterium]